MVRTLLPASLLLLLVAMAGCKMGIGPYDDCGPVWSQGQCQNCNTDYRAGSILNKGEAQGPGVQTGPPNVPNPMVDHAAAKPRSRTVQRVAAAQRSRQVDLVSDELPAPKKRPAPAQPPPRKVQRVAAEQSARQPQRTAEAPPVPIEQWTQAREPSPVRERPRLADRAPVGQTEPAPAGTTEGATRILSVTDRRLDEPAATEDSARELPAPPVRRSARGASEMQ